MSTYYFDREAEEADLVATAEAWSAYLGQTVSATDVSVLLAIAQRVAAVIPAPPDWHEASDFFAKVMARAKETAHV